VKKNKKVKILTLDFSIEMRSMEFVKKLMLRIKKHSIFMRRVKK